MIPLPMDPKLFGRSFDPSLRNRPGQTWRSTWSSTRTIDLPSPPKLALEFSKDGQLLGQTSLDLPASTGVEGRIPYLGTIPLASLNPGDYTIRFIVQQGSETAEESASLTQILG